MEKQQGNGLIYGLNDKPPFKEAFFAALQHLLAIFVAIITPPLIIAGALKLDAETTGYLVSMALFASGISTFIQCRRFGGLGTGLLCIQGTSFSFIGPIISAGMLGGLPLIFGSCMAASSVEMLISRVLKYTKKIITPLISGIVVTLIGMSLIKVGITACGGGATAQADGSFGSFRHVGLAAAVLLLIIAFNRSSNCYLRMSSIVIGLVIGYIAAWFMGIIDFSSIQSYGGFNLPMPFRYGLDFDLSTIIALGLIFMITAIEAYGDITANSLISGEPVEGDTFVKRASGGILADGFNSMLAGALNSFPNSVFAQEQRNDTTDRGCQPVCGLLHRSLSCAARPVPCRGTGVFTDARTRIGRRYSADIRYGGGGRHPHHCSAGNQPEGYPCHGCQFLARPQCGAGSRDTVPTAGNAAEHLRIRHHNGRDNGYSGKSADSYQGVILFYFRHGLHGISRICFVLCSFGQHYPSFTFP